MSQHLRLEIQPDGNAAGLFEGRFLVLRFKWRENLKVFEMIPINKTWDYLITHNDALRYYLDYVLGRLQDYRKEAVILAAMKAGIEGALSGYLSIDHSDKRKAHHSR